MEFFAGLIADEPDVVAWAREREAEGWHGLNISDHLASNGQSYPRLLVTLAQVAAVTETAKVTSGYANTLIRNPVDFAHAAMTLQQASGGRFEAGLGAGWAQEEAHYMGIDFLDGRRTRRRGRHTASVQRAWHRPMPRHGTRPRNLRNTRPRTPLEPQRSGNFARPGAATQFAAGWDCPSAPPPSRAMYRAAPRHRCIGVRD